MLQTLFPGLDADYACSFSLIPATRHEVAEFTAVIPKWQRIAGSYSEATLKVVALLEKPTAASSSYRAKAHGRASAPHGQEMKPPAAGSPSAGRLLRVRRPVRQTLGWGVRAPRADALPAGGIRPGTV